MENEEVGKELEDNEAKTEATEQKETNNTKEEKSPSAETEVKEAIPTSETEGTQVELEPIPEEQTPHYTAELVETDNFKLEIAHQITAGDMLVSMLLATNIIVILLCRLIRDRK